MSRQIQGRPARNVIFIDPGVKYFAFAIGDAEAREIFSFGMWWNPDLLSWPPWFVPGVYDVVCETQNPTENDKATRRDILGLSRMVGACASRSYSTPVYYEPNAWKGNVHKTVSHAKILKTFNKQELAAYQATANNYTGHDKRGNYILNAPLDLDDRYDLSHAGGGLLFHFNRYAP